MNDLERRLSNLEVEVSSLKNNVKSLRNSVRTTEKWIDTVSSPMWKRVWFVIQGYRFRQLGVWYKAKWNKDGWDY